MNEKIKVINNFLKDINPNYSCYEDNIFSSLWSTGEIWVNFNTTVTESDLYFINYIYNKYQIEPNCFLISMLHEIGHLETETQDLSDERAITYAVIEYAYDNNLITKNELFNKYFDIPAETLATEWAVNYYKNNKEKCEKLIQMLDI